MEAESQQIVNIEDEMKQSYMDYAMSVIVGRALPDVRDGLKPVQRRILYAMLGEGLVYNRKHSKCAGVVGEVLKRLHPHGDSSVYDALVRLAQSWNLRYPLVDGQGNFGSIDGDPAAAYRYTECRMSSIASKLLQDIDKDTVDFIANFDDTNVEPLVLPNVIPNLLINGADGIAVGMATHIPPHNIGEVVSGTLALLDDPEIDVHGLMKHIPGPDFPTGGILYGTSAIVSAYARGRGIVKIRAKAEVESIKIGSREAEAIVITEIPYQVNKSTLLEKIASLINEKLIEGISKLRDESDRTGMRIVMELKRDATADIVLNQLYKLTPLQGSFGIINLAIVEGQPVVCTLKELLGHFLDHRRDVVTRKTLFELRKAEERMHLLDGFRIALANLDEVIKIIRGAETPRDAKTALCSRFEFTETQAQAILDLRLQKLTGMERLAIEKEHAELAAIIEELMSLLADGKKIDAVIKSELEEALEQYGDERRTKIEEYEGDLDIEDLIEDEKMVVTATHGGYVKRTPMDTYRAQRRGGKGVAGASSGGEDFVEHLFTASTKANLLIFTDRGRMYWQKVYGLPNVSRTAKGRALVNLLRLSEGEAVSAIRAVDEFVDGRFIVLATKFGIAKRMDLMSFAKPRKGGVIACGLAEGDELIGAVITHGNDNIIINTSEGMAIKFSENDLRPMGRSGKGVRAIRIGEGSEVVSMVVVAQGSDEDADLANRVDSSATLVTVCENGHGKRTKLEDYRSQSRGGKGTIDIKTSARNGKVVGCAAVSDKCDLMVITSSGKIIRMNASDISVVGRNTQGVRLASLDEGEKVVAVAPVRDDGEGEQAEEVSGE